MLKSALFAVLALTSVAIATPPLCPGTYGSDGMEARSEHSHSHGMARRASPSGCTVRCNPTGINGRVLTLENSATYGGDHYSCQYDVPGGGSLVSCLFHNHDPDPNFSNFYYYNDGPGTRADCPTKLQTSCGGGAYGRRSTRRPLDALLRREKMGEVPADLKERRKVWKGKKAA